MLDGTLKVEIALSGDWTTEGRALSRVRVLDLGQHESGNMCTQLLGVIVGIIKVEPPKTEIDDLFRAASERRPR